jgi:regulator of CtrA degradation
MNGSVRESGSSGAQVVTVSFGERYAVSAAFDTVYRDGMGLVEETAAYLDGSGRKDAKGLKGALTLAYATESMRLTTRLMQLASWLLIRKAVNDGEMSRDDAVTERRKVRFASIGRPSHTKDFELLPARLRSLVERSFVLLDQIHRLDAVISGDQAPAAAPAPTDLVAETAHSPIEAQHQRLHAAFSVHELANARART